MNTQTLNVHCMSVAVATRHRRCDSVSRRFDCCRQLRRRRVFSNNSNLREFCGGVEG